MLSVLVLSFVTYSAVFAEGKRNYILILLPSSLAKVISKMI